MLTLTCEHCGKTFTAQSHRRGCDRRCSTYLGKLAKGYLPWQPEEEAILKDNSGSLPINDIIRAVQRLEQKRGWPIRSPSAIKTRFKRLKLRRPCIYNHFTPSELARIFGIPRDRVELWIERHGLPFRQVNGYHRGISLSGFRKWAQANQEKLAGIDAERLQWVLQNQTLTAQIAALPPPRIGYPQAVRCLDTGEVFPSLRAAAQKHYLSRRSITSAIARNGRAAGLRWAYVNPPQGNPHHG